MTQERINKYFQGSIGSQCDTLFSTSDNRVFIRYEDAVFNIKEEGLTDDNILQWWEEYEGENVEPILLSSEQF